MPPSEPLFLLGNGRSGTSTLMGILNCVPDIFLLFEVNANKGATLQKRDREFLSLYPEMADIFGKKENFAGYQDIAQKFAEAGYSYRYFGAKFPSINLSADQRQALRAHKVIWTVRDIRTWMCKNNNIYGWKLEEANSVPLAVQQVELFVESFLYPTILRLSMEDLVLKNEKCIAQLGQFLDIPLEKYTAEWWTRIGNYKPEDPKAKVTWWQGHDSSRLRPLKLDTTAQLNDHPFWNELLPIFDKYYQRLNQSFSEAEIQTDLATLSVLKDKYSAKVRELYAQVSSVSFGSGPEGERGHLSSNTALRPFEIAHPKLPGRLKKVFIIISSFRFPHYISRLFQKPRA